MVVIEISIIIPTRNRGEDLRRCLAALAGQTRPMENVEVLVCDDGSEESLAEVVAAASGDGLRITHLRQAPRGPAAARNLGISHARGAIIAMTDSDTQPQPGWLAALEEALAAHPEAVGVEGLVRADNVGRFDPLGEGPSNLTGGVFLTCNCAYRRQSLVAVGGFDETFPYPACEDTELAARIGALGPIIWQPAAVVIHPQRPLTLRTVLNKLRHWEYVLIMGLRYGYLGWQQYPTRYPRLRVAALSVIALPLSKLRTAANWFYRKPEAAAKLCLLAVVESLGALLTVVPMAFSRRIDQRIPRQGYLP